MGIGPASEFGGPTLLQKAGAHLRWITGTGKTAQPKFYDYHGRHGAHLPEAVRRKRMRSGDGRTPVAKVVPRLLCLRLLGLGVRAGRSCSERTRSAVDIAVATRGRRMAEPSPDSVLIQSIGP
jgi:hypothetical protein